MKTIICTLFLYFLVYLPVHSQYGWDVEYRYVGYRLGMGASTLSGIKKEATDEILQWIDSPDNSYSIDNKISWDTGLLLQNTFDNKVFIQTEFTYSLLGARIENKTHNNNSSSQINLHYAGINAYLGKKIDLKRNDKRNKFLCGAGLYGTMNLNEFFVSEPRPDIETYDIGATVMAGFEIDRVQLSIGYFHGLTNAFDNGSSVKNKALRVGIAYLI